MEGGHQDANNVMAFGYIPSSLCPYFLLTSCQGHLIQVILITIICDKPAVHKLAGFGAPPHTYFCAECWICQKDELSLSHRPCDLELSCYILQLQNSDSDSITHHDDSTLPHLLFSFPFAFCLLLDIFVYSCSCSLFFLSSRTIKTNHGHIQVILLCPNNLLANRHHHDCLFPCPDILFTSSHDKPIHNGCTSNTANYRNHHWQHCHHFPY
jgi:hypothetical protein